jgi:hypothetical protein
MEANGRVKRVIIVDADAFAWMEAKVVERLQQASRPK